MTGSRECDESTRRHAHALVDEEGSVDAAVRRASKFGERSLQRSHNQTAEGYFRIERCPSDQLTYSED